MITSEPRPPRLAALLLLTSVLPLAAVLAPGRCTRLLTFPGRVAVAVAVTLFVVAL